MAAPPPSELIVTGPDGVVTRYRLGELSIIGRHPECQVVLSDPMSSRRHCKITRAADGQHFVEDNGSANGTLLNGEPLKVRTPFRNGDTIQIGSTLLVLRIEVAAVRGAPPKNQYDPNVSIVRLEDESADAPSVDYVQKADAQVVSEEEAASSDVAKLKRVTERLKLLIEVGQSMGASLDPHKLLATCLDKLFQAFPQADRGLVVLYGSDGSLPASLTSEQEQGATLDRRKGAFTKVKFKNSNSQDSEIKLSRTVLNRVRQDRQSVLVSDASGDAAGMSMARFEIKSLMCAPLLVGNEDIGFIQLETKSRLQAFTPEDLNLMTAVAGQVAIVVRNSELALDAAAEAAQRENLSRFLSPNLVDGVLKGKVSVSLGGIEKKGTMFFSDIVSFTKMSEKMSAHNVVQLLNRYFTVMQNIIFKRGGSIDKCAGDAIMAHWGVIGDQPDFTLSAVTAAVEMQIALFAFNRDEARKNEIVLPPTPLGHGIGLNTGIVCAGNIGSDRKIEFTVIGEAVNLSARIETMAGRGQTIIGASTYEEIKDRTFCIRMPDCPAKNVTGLVKIYSVRGIVPPPFDGNVPPAKDLRLEDILFSIHCVVVPSGRDERINAMLTGITRHGGEGATLELQVEQPVAQGMAVTIEWNAAEKQLPALQGVVDRCLLPPDSVAKTVTGKDALSVAAPGQAASGSGSRVNAAVLVGPTAYGSVCVSITSLPAEIAAWRPGTLLQSEFKSHEDIIRA